MILAKPHFKECEEMPGGNVSGNLCFWTATISIHPRRRERRTEMDLALVGSCWVQDVYDPLPAAACASLQHMVARTGPSVSLSKCRGREEDEGRNHSWRTRQRNARLKAWDVSSHHNFCLWEVASFEPLSLKRSGFYISTRQFLDFSPIWEGQRMNSKRYGQGVLLSASVLLLSYSVYECQSV